MSLFMKRTQVIHHRGDAFVDYPPIQGHLWEIERFASGVFWLLIAASLLLALCERFSRSDMPRSFAAGWAGLFVLYYVLRSKVGRLPWSLRMRQQGVSRWRVLPGFPLAYAGDLFVISLFLLLSGGWESPLYLLYFGWVVTMLAASSWGYRLLVMVLAPLFLVGAVILAAHHPLSTEQMAITAEHLLLLVFISLGMSVLRMYLEWNERCWVAERQEWMLLRHSVFSQLSHELFTPLSAIQSSAALLADEVEEACFVGEHRRQLFEVIQRNCTRMVLLLDEMLEMWRSGQRQPPCAVKSVACVPLVEGIVHTLWPLFAAKKQECVVAAWPSSLAVMADTQRLEQVLVNLLSNAQKYSPMHTRVHLEIRGEEDEVRFAVRDEGPGIAYEEQRHLFSLAFRGTQTSASVWGVGLGLALAKALVIAQGGRIWVESSPGQGSTFYFTLPRAPLEEACDAYFAG
jgi:signal transduction histidine kinase